MVKAIWVMIKGLYTIAQNGGLQLQNKNTYSCMRVVFCMLCRHHMSALMYAAREGHAGVVQLLIDKHANLNKQDTKGYTVSSATALYSIVR